MPFYAGSECITSAGFLYFLFFSHTNVIASHVDHSTDLVPFNLKVKMKIKWKECHVDTQELIQSRTRQRKRA